MRSFSVTARGLSAVQVRSANWIAALGQGLQQLGKAESVQRLACEVLPNGTVIARDISSGTGYIVQEVDGVDTADHEAAPLDEEFFAAPADDDDDDDEAFALAGEGDDDELVEELLPLEDLEALPGDAIEAVAPDDHAERIAEADTVADAARLALELAREVIPAESGAVILEERGYLRFAAVTGPHSRKLVGVRLPVGTGVAGFAMSKRRSIVLGDAHEDPRHCGEVDALTGYRTEQIAVAPVIWNDHVYGVLELMNLPDDRRFLNDDIDQLESIAAALAHRLQRG